MFRWFIHWLLRPRGNRTSNKSTYHPTRHLYDDCN